MATTTRKRAVKATTETEVNTSVTNAPEEPKKVETAVKEAPKKEIR